jgi:hypothetical protein
MQSGTPYQRTYVFRDVEVTGRTVRIFAEERGARRLPNQANLDLRAEGRFRIGRATARVAVDIFNIFNSGTVTGVQTTDDPFADELYSIRALSIEPHPPPGGLFNRRRLNERAVVPSRRSAWPRCGSAAARPPGRLRRCGRTR